MSTLSFRRRNVATPFNLLVAGFSGLGKSTFLQTFYHSLNLTRDTRFVETENIPIRKTIGLTTKRVLAQEEGIKFAITLIDTPGFVEDATLEEQSNFLLRYIEGQLELKLAEESKLKRNPKPKEEQVHVCLYFLPPSDTGLSEADVTLMRKLGKRVNIIPVIGKADTLTVAGLKRAKEAINRDIHQQDIPIFNFPDLDDDDTEIIKENAELREMLPFSLIASDEFNEKSDKTSTFLGRRYPWGVVDCLNPDHCDFTPLKYVLINSHLNSLKEVTYSILYEQYRTNNLLKRMSHSPRPDNTRNSSPKSNHQDTNSEAHSSVTENDKEHRNDAESFTCNEDFHDAHGDTLPHMEVSKEPIVNPILPDPQHAGNHPSLPTVSIDPGAIASSNDHKLNDTGLDIEAGEETGFSTPRSSDESIRQSYIHRPWGHASQPALSQPGLKKKPSIAPSIRTIQFGGKPKEKKEKRRSANCSIA
ncbi:Cell division control protein 11 [Basidiobolus ranarum]|uniref:Cell division control protein 11 n=1 Tax=Basidiobolus ranarum TaxID=34480 RepID=A0ABR2WZ64_9FUNG